jgi:hypothetical protein
MQFWLGFFTGLLVGSLLKEALWKITEIRMLNKFRRQKADL